MAFKRLNRKQLEQLSDADLAAYLFQEDAADAIADGFTREEHLACYKLTARDAAALGWDQVTDATL